MNYDPNKAIRQALMVARRQAAYGGQQSYPGYRPINPLTGLPEDEGVQVVGSSYARPIGGGISDGGNDPGTPGPPGAPSTGNFGRDVTGFAEAAGPALGGMAIGGLMGGPAGAVMGGVASTMAQGLAEATGLSNPASAPPGGFASVAGNIAQTQMGMQPTSNPVDAINAAVTGPQSPADQEDADQGNAQAAADAAAAAAAAADNANSMSEAATADASADSDGGSNGDSGDAGGDGDGGGGGGFARGGDVKGGMLGENFSNWFGDSHVVEPKISSRDKSPNKPMVVYHGTPADISEFNPVGMGKVSHTFGDYETTRHGMFFAEDPEFASGFAQANTGGYKRPGANVLPVHLSIQNPLYIEPHGISEEDVSKLTQQGISEKWARNLGHPDYTWEAFDGDDGKFFVDALKAAGYDGVRYHETDPETKEAQRAWVAFNPTQIKSAIGNVGSYDPSDANITRADGGEIMPQRDLDADPSVRQALDVTAPFSVSNPMSVFPKPQRMWEDQRPGGAYLAMPTKEDITGHKAAQAEIGVSPGGKPFFNVSRDAVEETGSPGRGSATVKTNLFKQKAGWQWAQAPEGHENTNTLVSINHRGKHHYALNAQFPKGVDLARYENAPTEPRLRPTTKGNVELGEQVGTIMVRGKEHPVYRNAIVRNAGGAVGYADGGMPGDDPTVQRAMDITRQAQPSAPQMARQVQPQAMPAMQSKLIETEDHPAWIPTRLITSKKAVATPGQKDIVDLESMRQTPKLYQQNVDLVRAYPNMPISMADASHDDMAEHFVNHVKDNLLSLHDAVPEEIRNRSRLWYDGCRNIVDRWSRKYNLPDHSIAASLAALSPQKDWYQNVSLSERVLEAMRGQNGDFYQKFAFDDGMRNKFANIAAFQKPEYQKLLGILDGKTLADLGELPADEDTKAAAKALWIRLHDETYNDRSHKIVTPEGDFGDFVKTQKGENAGTGWGSLNEIGKAIRSIEAAEDPALISSLMGEKHKVRNFYNNILAPRSPHGDVTIDTHAVAAGLYRPLSGNSLEVAHNFANYAGKGVPSAAGSALTGIQGTYPLYAEAYRRAAEERSILPREMQSITWEAVRGLFPDTFKTATNNKKVDAVWNRYKNSEISQQDARGLINEITGGIRNPSWFVQGGAGPNEIGQPSDEPRNISGIGVRRPTAEGIERRAGGKPAAPVQAGARGSRPSPQIKEAASGGSIVDRALRITSANRPMVALADLFQRQLRGRPPS